MRGSDCGDHSSSCGGGPACIQHHLRLPRRQAAPFPLRGRTGLVSHRGAGLLDGSFSFCLTFKVLGSADKISSNIWYTISPVKTVFCGDASQVFYTFRRRGPGNQAARTIAQRRETSENIAAASSRLTQHNYHHKYFHLTFLLKRYIRRF